MNSLRERLKQETLPEHRRLESQLNLLRDDFQLDDLKRLLERFYGYYRPCESESTAGLLLLERLLAERRKTPLLVADLRHFGHDDASLAALPQCRVTAANTTARVLGRWYVFEGSTLGGQLLTAHFQKRFHLTTDRGCSFFQPYGNRVGEMWRSYCRLIDEYSSPEVDDAAIDAARETFRSMSEWLRIEREGETPAEALAD